MTTDEVRGKYIKFFTSGNRAHKEISPAPLAIENDPSTLFTSAGMQPLIPFLMGEPHPMGKRLVNSQPCIRTQDIDEVGDTSHTTFFEMLGNWSLGEYFKKEQLVWFWEFLTKELVLPENKLWVTVYAGNKNIPKDIESYKIWQKLDLPKERINYIDSNWWSRSGQPDQMPIGEIGGPDSEVFFEFESVIDEKYGKNFNPDSKRFLEIGNSVFLQYKKILPLRGKKTENGLEELPQKNVDFGGGLERLTAAANNNPDVFQIDIFQKIISEIEKISQKSYEGNEKEMRIIADHLRASEMLIKEGILPGNKLQGYILRRLIRRSALKMKSLKQNLENADLTLSSENKVNQVIEEEVAKFKKTLESGLRQIGKTTPFDLFQSYGFPPELTKEIYISKGLKFEEDEFKKAFEKHQEKSRTASAGVFKGGLADSSKEVTRLHTATHLLHAALRKVLGDHVSQKGSNITAERLRFDFIHPAPLTADEIKNVEDLVNEQIDKNLPVNFETMSLEDAKHQGALAFFGHKYGEKVKVYSIGTFSKEVCGGPHIKNLSEMGGHVRIIKESASGAGVRRIYARI